MNPKILLTAFLATAGLASVATIAQADGAKADSKTYSGVGCTEMADGIIFPDTPQPYGDDDVRYNAAGWAYNSSQNHSITVICPIVREHNNKPMKRAWITIFNDTTEKVICEIEAYDKNGDWLEQSTQYIFSPSPKAQKGFKSNDKDDDDGGAFDNSFEFVPKLSNDHGYFTLVCRLPAAVQLVDEDGAGSGVSYNMANIISYVIDEVSN